MNEDLLLIAAIYSAFCALDLVQHLPLAYLVFDVFIVSLLLLLAGETGEWIL